MKKIYSVLSVLLTIILMGVFVSCERDKEVMLTAVSITNEQITPMYKSATISSTISSEATIRDVFVQYTVTKDFAEYDEVPMQEKDGIYTAELIDLLDNTTYYYRYAASNRHSAIVLQKIQQFATLQPTAPAIRLDSILTVWDSYAQVQVALEFDGGASVTDMGVCWGTQANPTIEDIHKSTKDTVAVLDIPSLQPNTQYYVRAYAVNKVGVAYSEEKEFTTLALPEVRTEDVSDIQVNSAFLLATLVFDGNDTATIKGFCWSDKSEPTIEGDHIAIDTASAGYTYALTALLSETQYFVRAYAQNKVGIVYGEEVSFTTKEQSSTPNSGTENGYAYVDLGLSVKWATCNVGASSPEDYGDYFAWGETTPKDYYDWSTYKYCNGSDDSLTKYCDKSSYGNNGFTDNKTQLELSDDAARANWGGSWRMPSNEERNELIDNCTWEWTTQNGVNGYKVTSKSNGNSIFLPAAGYRYDSSLISAGSRGLYWSSSLGTDYPYYAWGVYFNSGYVYRDYGSRSYGHSVRPVLGENKGTETTVPTVTTAAITQITETTAVAGGNVTSDGNATVTERGVVYSTKQNPTISDNKKLNGSGVGSFVCDLSNLQAGTTYYVRAYAINNKGTAYGDEVSFTTAVPITLATVTTASITNITETSAVAGGNVTSDGGASVTERGVVYATTQNPTTADNKVSNGSGMGTFTCNLTDLQANTTYYVRAYAINSKGTAYGEEVTFITNKQIVLPSVITSAITQITETSAVAGGNVTSDGGASVTERGVVYSTNPSPVITNLSNTIRPCGSGTGVFTYTMTGLQANTTYYVRAYATNEVGTAYGEEMSFTTETPAVHEYVDLGLSVKWATCNVGASSPEGYGDYFAWGEIESKEVYDWSTYKWCNNGSETMLLIKYNEDSSYGTIDNKTRLDLSDDAARANWGGDWRMPTDAELAELIEQCTWTWTTQNGVNGYKVTSKSNDNSIFLPATGCCGGGPFDEGGSIGFYWSSSLSTGGSNIAWCMNFAWNYVYWDDGSERYVGYTVRPVWGEYVMEETVPTIITSAITQITETTAVAGGNVIRDGNASVTEKGVVYGKSPNPTISNLSNTIRPCGRGIGEFTYNMTDLQPSTTYYVRAYATNEKGTAYGEEVSFTTKEQSSTPNNSTENGYAYVDLGLSVKWATCNVGANNPEDYGDYFAWGETEPKDTYNRSTYKWCNDSSSKLTKYCNYNGSGNDGFTDNKTQLELSDDAAHVNWGGSWRMPTYAEWTELREQCTWTWTIQNGVNGCRVTSKTNGNSIFLPAAGRRSGSSLYFAGSSGCYWSSSLDTDNPNNAWFVNISYNGVGRNNDSRRDGRSVRPVCP